MIITKFGHCCLLVEENGLRILTDPGIYSTSQNDAKNIDVILITHEHADHFHIDSVKMILKNNPHVKIITNIAIATLLKKENIQSTIIEENEKTIEKDVSIEGIGNMHAVIYPSLPIAQNTGYFIADKFFYPGDAFTNPNRPVEILAAPMAGPWMKISEGIDYVKELKPRICFPVHDGIYKDAGLAHRVPKMVFDPLGVQFKILEIDSPTEF